MAVPGMLPQILGEYGDIASATQPFMSGPVGQSPVLQQAVDQFKALTMPVIQNQFALQGLGNSPALGQAIGVSMGNALVPLISEDMKNRLSAINLAQQRVGGAGQLQLGQQELDQMAALRGAQVADASAGRQLQSLGLAGQFGAASGNQMSDLSNQLRQRQELSLSAYGSAGEAQRNVRQQAYDSAYQDYLRRQALSEASSTGLFGGSVLPPTLQQSSRTKTSSDK